jgi:hypothetical protein
VNWLTTRLQIAASIVTPAGRTTVKQILASKREVDTSAEASEWAQALAAPQSDALSSLNAELWVEACAYEEALRLEAEHSWGPRIASLGGGGDVAVLYFLARFRQPTFIVETGVAAGWSSRALLDAAQANGTGVLYSSDLPYVWQVDGAFPFAPLVPSRLRENWFVSTVGDRKSLPELRSRVNRIDLFHYDSDKTYGGREFAMECLRPMFTQDTIIVMDDIQNNLYFRDFCESSGLDPVIFRYQEKYLGVAGGAFSP